MFVQKQEDQFPGGFGTHDKGMETLTLVQTGKRNALPLILVDEPEISHLPRLVVDCNRKSFARLKQLIDAVNEAT